MAYRVLVVDDEEPIRKLLAGRFSREGWLVDVAEDGKKALQYATTHPYLCIVTDIKMPELSGFQLIEKLREKNIECPVVVITGHGEKESAIEAIHKGAFDYLEKPFDMNEIVFVVKRALEREELRLANIKLLEVKTQLLKHAEKNFENAEEILVGKSSHIENLKQMIKAMSESFTGDNDPVVLITGESGVGKEMVARYFHSLISAKDKPFVAINCAAFPENLLESELFGYEKGAFTGANSRKLGLFELASGGTLFLDEIGEMDLRMQAKLLRVLQERVIRRLGGTSDIAVKPHIIAATNRDLTKMVHEKLFREDLFYRLNTLPIAVAPLRQRTEDIEHLASYFLKQLAANRGKNFNGFSTSALKAMGQYRWPGNVRELRSVIERAIILEKGEKIELSHLRQEHLRVASDPIVENASPANPTTDAKVIELKQLESLGLSELRKEMDEKLVRKVLFDCLNQYRGNVSAISRALKLDRANLLRMLKRYQIDPELFRKQVS